MKGAGSNMRHLGDGAGGSLVQHRGFWGYELGGLTDAVGSIWWMEKGSHGLATAFEGQSIPVQKPLPRLQPLSPPRPCQQDGMHEASPGSYSSCDPRGFLMALWPPLTTQLVLGLARGTPLPQAAPWHWPPVRWDEPPVPGREMLLQKPP